VSEFPQPAAPEELAAGDGGEIDALPVLVADARVVAAQRSTAAPPSEWRGAGTVIPAVQAAAVAAGGLVAGAALAGLVHRRQRHSSVLGKGRRGRGGLKARRRRSPGARGAGPALELFQIVGSRSLLVDVHLLGSAGDR
jgi:hypothetical protein